MRWDTKEFWSGFTLDLAFGAGGDRDGDTESEEASSNYYHGIAAHQQFKYDGGWVQLDIAYEMNYDTAQLNEDGNDTGEYWDNTTYLIGVQGGHGAVGYFGQYRVAEAESTKAGVADQEETGYSVGMTYNFGADNKWQAKVAHAKLDDLEKGNMTADTGREVWSTQLLYSIDTNAVVYARYRDIERSETDKDDSFNEASVGVEYWF
ncbi:hypothetical protein [Endozoicomonas sp. SCSIO W0465]|uniref:hypothetical protein n=1 Tax=Endozoicomonas sp. SCSIO W0465 TaxID=2918516 RepID=UPI002074E0DF|nr:hypothetical protein [Endozoicomonas sp. SCSIO W0465]USE38199.1 hypothetical protein MJO57_08560 [Endozoicomonas sp. SCSIO W0465]